MLERMLSPRGFKIYLVLTLSMLGYVLWLTFTQRGIANWLNRFQAEHIFSGHYYPELTVLLLVIPIASLGWGIGLFHDYLSSQGVFTDRDQPEEQIDPDSYVTYRETNRRELIERVRAKFQVPIGELKQLGFIEMCFHSETVPSLGLRHGSLGLGGAFGFLTNEIARLGRNLSVTGYFALMVSREESTYANIFGLGVSFFTLFTDGTCLISSNYRGTVIQDDGQKLNKASVSRSIPSAWTEHKQRAGKLRQQGKVVRDDISFANYAAMSKRLDDYTFQNRSKVIKASSAEADKPGRSFFSSILSILISAGVFLSCFLAFTFLGGLANRIYPSCWFVRNIPSPNLPLHFLAVPALMAASWFLARLETGLLTVNGIGTGFRGKDPVAGSPGYISTKWLVLPGVPLLPVRSYLIVEEDTGLWNRKNYQMQPLKEIRWSQVKQTVRKSWLGYGVLALLYIGFFAWTISECR